MYIPEMVPNDRVREYRFKNLHLPTFIFATINQSENVARTITTKYNISFMAFVGNKVQTNWRKLSI